MTEVAYLAGAWNPGHVHETLSRLVDNMSLEMGEDTRKVALDWILKWLEIEFELENKIVVPPPIR